ncbi:MAG TPA: CHASE domain-containing protein [Polyangiaceae bacterium]|nr:CHASE domain-containing protein [Polyangiaceae bacterium]
MMGAAALRVSRADAGRWYLRIGLTALVYWIAGRAAIAIAIDPGYATPVWPAAGVALCAVLVWGKRMALGVALGSIAVNAATGYLPGNPETLLRSLSIALGIGTGAALQAVLGALLIEKHVGLPAFLEDEQNVARCTVLGGPVACLVSASLGVGTLCAAGVVPWSNCLFSAATWWVGDSIGVLIFAPLCLISRAVLEVPWQRGRATLVLPLLGSFAVVTLLFLQSSAWERSRRQTEFERRATHLTHTLQAALTEYEEAVFFLAGLFDASNEVTRHEFAEFSYRTLAHHPGLRLLGWSPLVPDQERLVFEKRALADGLQGFHFTERDAQGSLRSANSRPSYLPTYYVEPADSGAFSLGFDSASDPVCRRALARGADAGAASVACRWGDPGASEQAIAVFVPIFAGGARAAARGERQLRGFAAGVVEIGAVVRSALAGLDQGDLELSLFEAGGGQPLYQSRGTAGATPSSLRDDPSGPQHADALDLGGQRYRVEVRPLTASFATSQGWQAWLVLGAGLFFMRVMGMSTLVSLGRASRAQRSMEEGERRGLELEERVRDRTAELSATLKERELLLQEIHHRVKNNLQVISSLINLQVRGLAVGASRDALTECQARVYTIALIHESLYESRDYCNLPFSDFVRSLASSLFQLSGAPSAVSLELDLAPVSLTVDRAIPCGLILNELIVNALKHAFPEGRRGTLRVQLRKLADDRVLLSVEDDGVGVSSDGEAPGGALGLQLVRTLAQQVHAELLVRHGQGTTVELRFRGRE